MQAKVGPGGGLRPAASMPAKAGKVKKTKKGAGEKAQAPTEDDAEFDVLRAAADRAAAEKAASEHRADGADGDPGAAGAGPGAGGAEGGSAADLVLGFQATPLAPKPPPSQDELGNPSAAQDKAAARRRQEQALEARQREPHEGGLVTARDGLGTTPYSHRLRHQVSARSPRSAFGPCQRCGPAARCYIFAHYRRRVRRAHQVPPARLTGGAGGVCAAG